MAAFAIDPGFDFGLLHVSPELFEYMAARTPIIASDLPSAREILSDRKNALLIPPDDAEAWGRGMAELLGNRVLAEELAARAFEDVKEYTWEKRAEKIIRYLRCLRRAAEKQSSGPPKPRTGPGFGVSSGFFIKDGDRK